MCPSGGIIGQLSVCGPYRGIICGPYRGIIGQLSVPSAFDAAMQQSPGIDDNILLILPSKFQGSIFAKSNFSWIHANVNFWQIPRWMDFYNIVVAEPTAAKVNLNW